MKFFTLAIAMSLLSVVSFAQDNPCPNIVSYNFGSITPVGTMCTSTFKVTSSGIGVSAQKGLMVEVYQISVSPGNLVSTSCFTVLGGSAPAVYETAPFTIDCSFPVFYVITRTTASNGTCSGGVCNGSIVITGGGGSLPIKISSFYAKRNNNVVALTWTSETEINAKEYVIERNTGNGFVTVGTVPAANLVNGSAYTFNDNNNSKTVSQYRLKLIDNDASFKYSEIKAVKGSATVSDFTIYPNPSIGTAKVTIADISEATTVQLLDNSGRLVKTIELRNSNSVELNNLQKGVYLVRITNNTTGDALTKKLTVIN